MTETEAWRLAEDGLERRDYTQVLVACDALQECGLEAEAQCLRWYARKGHQRWGLQQISYYLPYATEKETEWLVDYGEPHEEGYRRVSQGHKNLMQAVLSLDKERTAELEFYSE